MSKYQVVQVKAEPCPTSSGSRHILEVELRGLDGNHPATTPVVRLMISAGDAITAVSTSTGIESDIRKGRCVCGVKSVRSVHGTRADDDLTGLPTFG